MTSSSSNTEPRIQKDSSTRARIVDTQPLLRALVHESRRRSQTLRQLAEILGVDYRRLAQWRSDDASIARAHRSVFERAARYLQIPYVLVLVLAGAIKLQDLTWPDGSKDMLDRRIRSGIGQLRNDPVYGGAVPAELEHAPRDIKLFVLFLYDQVQGDIAIPGEEKPVRWLSTLRDVRALLDGVNAVPVEAQQ